MTCQCGSPASGWLCDSCVEAFEYRLAEVDSVVDELTAVVPRLTLTATYGQRASSGQALHAPAPVNIGAVSSLDELHRWLVNTALRLSDDTRVRLEGRSHKAVSSWLITNMGDLRQRNWCTCLHKELDALLRECERAARLIEHKQFAGACQTEGCNADLFVVAGQNRTKCKVCGSEYEAIQEWRNGAKEYARQADQDTIGYPQAISERLARIHGLDVGADYIRVLASRGTLQRANPERGEDGKKLRAMYRLGDVKRALGLAS